MNWLSVCTIGFMSTANEKYSMKTADAQQASIGAKLAQVTLAQKVMAAIGTAALVAICAATYIWSKTPDFRILYANLNDKDGGAVIAALTQMNVPYKMTDGGGAIMVPLEKVHDLRLRLASQGLPKGGNVGFELLENQKFGVTQFQEKMNYQRGLEGELSKSIQALGSVDSARVHLALPSQSGFFRDQQKPSASVILNMRNGHSLDRGQVAGIVHLIASSVHDLNPKNVSLIDQTGNLLSADQDGRGGRDGREVTQLQYAKQVEGTHVARIVELLEPLVGKGNVKAHVSVELDFTQSESTAEIFKPNQAADQAAIRNQQISEVPLQNSGQSSLPAGGVPGALSNQPTPNPSAPVNAPAQPLAAAQAAGTSPVASSMSSQKQRDSSTNFEVDKTVKITRDPVGSTKRLSVAVVVNHVKAVGEDGKTSLAAIKPEQITQMTALVKEAVGFNSGRGDSMNLVNAPFTTEEVSKAVEVPVWMNPELIVIGKEVSKYLGLLLLAFIVINKAIKPTIKIAQQQAETRRIQATINDPLSLAAIDADASGNAQGNQATQRILGQARQDPVAVANVVKNWVPN
jgi:flagellar M-ring protein FliF